MDEHNLMLPGGYDPHIGSDGYFYNPRMADIATEIIGMCHIDVAGELRPFDMYPEQVAFVRNLYGWRHIKQPKRRRYSDALIYIPRKNGKTTFGAALAIVEMLTTTAPDALFYSISQTKENANLVYTACKNMATNSPDIRSHIEAFQYAMRGRRTNARLTILSSETRGKQGFKPHWLLVDEVHDFDVQTEGAVKAMIAGMAASWNGLRLYTTTADCDRESMCNTKYKHALAVIENPKRDPRFLPLVFHTVDDIDINDAEARRAALVAANPNYGIGTDPEFYQQQWNELGATASGQDFFRRFYLNQQTRSGTAGWLLPGSWDALATDVKREGQCIGGLDLATTHDMAAWCMYWPATQSFSWRLWGPDSVGDTRVDGRPLRSLPGVRIFPRDIDHEAVRNEIIEDMRRYRIGRVGFDPAGASMMVQQIEKATKASMIKISSTSHSLTPSIVEFEKLIMLRGMRQDGGPALKWMAENCVAERRADGEQIMLRKLTAKNKIDGVMAALYAVAACVRQGAKDVAPRQLNLDSYLFRKSD